MKTFEIWKNYTFEEAHNFRHHLRSVKFSIRVLSRFFDRVGHETTYASLEEISIFSLNNVTVRLTKIMNSLLEHLKILIFKVIFQYSKLVESFWFYYSHSKVCSWLKQCVAYFCLSDFSLLRLAWKLNQKYWKVDQKLCKHYNTVLIMIAL